MTICFGKDATYLARTHESAPQRMHFEPRATGFLGSLASIAKYFSVSVESGRMCLQFVHSAKWNRFCCGVEDESVLAGADNE